MHANLRRAVMLIAGVLVSAGVSSAQEGASVGRRTPSITYYGSGVNQQIDEQQYLANQREYPDHQRYAVEGQQGAHLARMEEARRQRTAIGYGDISDVTGNKRTIFVNGHIRSDGTRVRPYYKSIR